MARFPKRVARPSVVRFLFGQRMRVLLFMDQILCFTNHLVKLLLEPQTSENRTSILPVKLFSLFLQIFLFLLYSLFKVLFFLFSLLYFVELAKVMILQIRMILFISGNGLPLNLRFILALYHAVILLGFQ